jgi:mono/diheme cytochrome c family protein
LAYADDEVVARGRYLVTITGCNDCHTPGYPETGGKVPESDWLIGVPVGFNGPWGTSYPANLRRVVSTMDEKQFAARARSELLPPMPWYSLVPMSDADINAMYRFIRSLGPAGDVMPPYVPPGQKIKTPYVVFEPVEDE